MSQTLREILEDQPPVPTKCILVKLQDQNFFTEKNNLPYLVEFAKNHSATLLLVEAITKPASLKELSEQIKANESSEFSALKVIKEILSCAKTKRASIQKSIRDELLNGSIVSVKYLSNKHPKINPATLRYHLNIVKNNMAQEGYTFVEEGRGKFTTNPEP